MPPARRFTEHCRTVRRPPEARPWAKTLRERPSSGALRCPLCAGVHLALGSENAAPFLVLGDRHAAFDADSDPLARLAIAGKQLLQDGHECSH